MANKLFYITGTTEDGFNCSLFVYADTPEQAFEIWKAHEVGQVCGVYFGTDLEDGDPDEASENDLRIFDIPLTPNGPAGALPWHSPAGPVCVAWAEEV